MLNRLSLKLISLVTLCLLTWPFFNSQAAQTASFSLSLDKAPIYIGDTFQVIIKLDPQRQMAQLGRVNFNYSNDIIEVIKFIPGSAYPVASPGNALTGSYISAGAFRLGTGETNLAEFGRLEFVANKVGTTTLNWAGDNHIISPEQTELLNTGSLQPLTINISPKNDDGSDETEEVEQTNENQNNNNNSGNSENSGGTIVIKPLQIHSTSHPISGHWYNRNDVYLTWTHDKIATGYAYKFNNISQVNLGSPNDSMQAQWQQSNVDDGVWWFHLKAWYDDNTSESKNYNIKIDTVQPEYFEPSLDFNLVDGQDIFTLYFQTTDQLSGIDRYELKFDDTAPVVASSPYEIESKYYDSNEVTVLAYDKAGNTREAKLPLRDWFAQLDLAQPYRQSLMVEPPIITTAGEPFIKKTFFYNQDLLLFAGTSLPFATIQLFIEDTDIIMTTKADSTGNWFVYLEQPLPEGDYTVYGIATLRASEIAPPDYVFAGDANKELDSAPSERVGFNLAGGFIVNNRLKVWGRLFWLWWLLLILFLIWYVYRRYQKRKAMKRKLK